MMKPPRLRSRRRRCRSVRPHHVFFHRVKLIVTVTKRAADVDRWVEMTLHNHSHRLQDLVIGLDIEWHPCRRQEGEEEDNPAATLQLCVGRSCLVFLLLHRDYFPHSLLAFLGNPFFTFVGVGVQDDAKKILRDHGLIVRKVVDLRHLAVWVYGLEEFLRMGLKRMAWEVVGRVMEKPLDVTLSDWDAKQLTFSQIEYASIDAYVSFRIGINLFMAAGCF
ncbi:PREDICTED: Werner Syndrome-like exonuclease [Ipomoea nil]|uniref:Werner Syndrome-like exonuclease n=1 Tax=Ipomoea nil TaxID=35883 RepID=UPI0009011889|nr:PREDICTED: Werner Syndrome-like exonuclease [Ipomoea nil]